MPCRKLVTYHIILYYKKADTFPQMSIISLTEAYGDQALMGEQKLSSIGLTLYAVHEIACSRTLFCNSVFFESCHFVIAE